MGEPPGKKKPNRPRVYTGGLPLGRDGFDRATSISPRTTATPLTPARVRGEGGGGSDWIRFYQVGPCWIWILFLFWIYQIMYVTFHPTALQCSEQTERASLGQKSSFYSSIQRTGNCAADVFGVCRPRRKIAPDSTQVFSGRQRAVWSRFIATCVSLTFSGLLVKSKKHSTIKSGPIRHYTSSPCIPKPHFNAAEWSQWSVFRPSLPQTTRRVGNKLCKFCESCSMIGNGLWYSNGISRIQ